MRYGTIIIPLLVAACSSTDHVVGVNEDDVSQGTDKSASDDDAPESPRGGEAPASTERADASKATDAGEGSTTTVEPAPACEAELPAGAVPFAPTEARSPYDGILRFRTGGDCLRVSYEPELAEYAELLSEAIERLEALDCLNLCFEPPVSSREPSEVDPQAWRGIHLAEWKQPSASNAVLISELFYDKATGELLQSHLRVIETGKPLLLEVGLLHDFCHGLGVAHSEAVDSLMFPNVSPDTNLHDLTDDVTASLCAVYGDEPLCPFE